MSNRLEILQNSKAKKESTLADKLQNHFDTVKAANGQPLNDKRNGQLTLDRWERQNDSIRNQIESVEKTDAAIERELTKISSTQAAYDKLPDYLREKVDSGEFIQWRKFPHILFVTGVDGGRLKVDFKKKTVIYTNLSKVSSDQYPIFRDAVNGVREWLLSDGGWA